MASSICGKRTSKCLPTWIIVGIVHWYDIKSCFQPIVKISFENVQNGKPNNTICPKFHDVDKVFLGVNDPAKSTVR